MKITFENHGTSQVNFEGQGFKVLEKSESPRDSRAVSLAPSLNMNKEYRTGNKSVTDVIDEFASRDVTAEQNAMTVLSNTLSGEQYEAYTREGNFSDVDLSDSETIVDHIKLELIKGGVEVKGYTDNLPPELEKEVKVTMEKASGITEINDGMKRALVAEGCPITIDNLYLARFTQSDISGETGNFFSMETPGYYGEKAVTEDVQALRAQVEQFLKDDGVEVTETKVDEAIWLVKNSLEINAVNIERLEKISSVQVPLTGESVKRAIDIALLEGNKPGEADLTRTESVYHEAIRKTEELKRLSEAEIHAKRVLEEVRLMMTTETNLKLLKSGIAIDTEDLEAYVNALKEAEKKPEFAELRELERTASVIEEVKNAPAPIVGRMIEIPEIDNLEAIKNEGEAMKARFEKAGEEYEKLFTEVRKDLGDSIKKAFRNVDALLFEGGFEVNEANRRAVRILGSNSMEINGENLEKVKALDLKLNSIISKLTPEDTLKLIRNGKSPVDMKIEELGAYLEEKRNKDEARMEKYSKFLFKLERADEITADERKEYIEVYRLLTGLERTGYAAIGSLVKTGRELSLGNLKEEIRSTRKIGMDVKVDESFGLLVQNLVDELEPVKMKAAGINDSTVLEEAYEEMKNGQGDSEAEALYTDEAFKELREGLEVSENTIKEIIGRGEPVTVGNLLSTERFMKNKSRAFKKVDELRGEDFRKEIEDIVENGNEKEKISTKYDEMIDNSQSSVARAAMESTTYLDVRELVLTHKELTVAGNMARSESYNVPMIIDGEMTVVSLKIVHNSEEEPGVKVMLETAELGSVSASLAGTEENITGFIACNTQEAVTKIKKAADILGKNVTVVYSPDKNDNAFYEIPMKDNSDKVSTAKLYRIAHRFLKAVQGE